MLHRLVLPSACSLAPTFQRVSGVTERQKKSHSVHKNIMLSSRLNDLNDKKHRKTLALGSVVIIVLSDVLTEEKSKGHCKISTYFH